MSQMLAETRQQPEALSKTLHDGFAALRDLKREFEARPPRLIILVARGTSDNAAQFGRYLIEITTRIPVSLAAPSVLTLYQCPLDLTGVLVAGISQSGESTDTNAVLEDARARGAVTVGITNQSDSAMARVAQYVIPVRAGQEESVAATKTYTCQLLALYLLAAALGGAGRCGNPAPPAGLGACGARTRGTRGGDCRALHVHDAGGDRGPRPKLRQRAELGLKLMETCYVVAERFSSADLMHGPIALD